MHKSIRRKITLIEMMIVMFLIAMIIGVVAYNYQGTLDEGKAFKTKTAKEKLSTVLTIIISNDPDKQDNLDQQWKDYINRSPLIQNANDIIKDGWGNEFRVTLDNDGQVNVESDKYNEYIRQNPSSGFREN